MRENKYRAWNTSCKEYVYNIEQENDGCIGPCDCFGDYLNNDNYVVEQYTGLKDKNGKEIYEGDVLNIGETSCAQSGSVVFQEGCFSVVVPWSDNIIPLKEYCNNVFIGCVEVIGNIHETPELLNG